MKKSLSDLYLNEISDICAEYSQPSYRAKSIFKWVAAGKPISQMSDLPQSFRAKLDEEYSACCVEIIEKIKSADGSVKMLYRLDDGNVIEGIFIPHSYGNSLCVSTQVGCRMGCAFCASGIGGLVRNLSAGEIYSQAIAVRREFGALSNVVLMGSGEPLDNYDNVTKFLRLVCNEDGLNMSKRGISLSTCGITENMRRLADDGFSVTLSISLHATTDEERRKNMPIAYKYSIAEVMDAAEYYFRKTGRRVAIEYALIKEDNMNYYDAKRLRDLTKKFSAHVNLIMVNPVKEKNVKGCTAAEAQRFLEWLGSFNVSATIRRSAGADVGGACGQLRRRYLDEPRG